MPPEPWMVRALQSRAWVLPRDWGPRPWALPRVEESPTWTSSPQPWMAEVWETRPWVLPRAWGPPAWASGPEPWSARLWRPPAWASGPEPWMAQAWETRLWACRGLGSFGIGRCRRFGNLGLGRCLGFGLSGYCWGDWIMSPRTGLGLSAGSWASLDSVPADSRGTGGGNKGSELLAAEVELRSAPAGGGHGSAGWLTLEAPPERPAHRCWRWLIRPGTGSDGAPARVGRGLCRSRKCRLRRCWR